MLESSLNHAWVKLEPSLKDLCIFYDISLCQAKFRLEPTLEHGTWWAQKVVYQKAMILTLSLSLSFPFDFLSLPLGGLDFFLKRNWSNHLLLKEAILTWYKGNYINLMLHCILEGFWITQFYIKLESLNRHRIVYQTIDFFKSPLVKLVGN